MKIFVDRNECIGCGMCAELCPSVLRMDDDEKAEVYGEVTLSNETEAIDAVDTCPVAALFIEE